MRTRARDLLLPQYTVGMKYGVRRNVPCCSSGLLGPGRIATWVGQATKTDSYSDKRVRRPAVGRPGGLSVFVVEPGGLPP